LKTSQQCAMVKDACKAHCQHTGIRGCNGMKIFTALMIFILFFTPNFLSAKAFHLFLAGDTEDAGVGTDIVIDLKNIQESFTHIAALTNVPLNVYKITSSDKTFTYNHLKTRFHKAHVAKDDVVIFYYSGHGARSLHTRMIWPCLQFHKRIVDSAKIIKRLFLKKAALSIVLINACNTFSRRLSGKNIDVFQLKRLEGPHVTANLQKLFFSKCGILIASAAKPGQAAYGANPSYVEGQLTEGGSFFTNSFLNILFDMLSLESPNWETIFKTTKKICHLEHKERHVRPQTPQYAILLGAKKKKVHEYMRHLSKHCIYGKDAYTLQAPENGIPFDEAYFEMNIEENDSIAEEKK